MARPQFYELTICDIRQETDDAKSIAFEVPEHLREELAFKQGQYLTLRATINGEELRRPYSVCVPPSSGEWRVCIKRDYLGRFSGYANDVLKVGDKMDVMRKAMGRFYTPIEPERAKSYVMLAGGSGVTPILSNIITILEEEPLSQITLFYGNRTMSGVIFRELFNDLKDKYMDRFRLFHILSDEIPEVPLYGGLMNEEKVTELLRALTTPLEVDWYMICGPGPMMEGAEAALKALGVDEERIKVESFGNRPVVNKAAAPPPPAAVHVGEESEVEIILHGVRTRMKMARGGKPIIDAAHEARIDAPFSCKDGVCSTCRARLVEGEVEMGTVHGLEPDEIEAGYILTCQARPKSKKVVVDFDV